MTRMESKRVFIAGDGARHWIAMASVRLNAGQRLYAGSARVERVGPRQYTVYDGSDTACRTVNRRQRALRLAADIAVEAASASETKIT